MPPTHSILSPCSQPSRTGPSSRSDAPQRRVAEKSAILDRCSRRSTHGRAGRGGRMVPIEQKDGTRTTSIAVGPLGLRDNKGPSRHTFVHRRGRGHGWGTPANRFVAGRKTMLNSVSATRRPLLRQGKPRTNNRNCGIPTRVSELDHRRLQASPPPMHAHLNPTCSAPRQQ